MAFTPSLPHELWESILKRLDFVSIVKCTQVCRDIYQAIEGSPLLNYIIELGVAGYIDNPCYIASPAQRILLLAERIRYWKDMTWSDKFTLETEGNYSQHPKDVKFSRGTILRTGIVELGVRKERIYELAPIKIERSNTIQPPLLFNLNIDQAVINIDVGQDLMILATGNVEVGLTIHFRHLKTMLPHPNAAVPEVILARTLRPISKETQIVENVFSVIYTGETTSIVTKIIEVFNWNKGKSILKTYPPNHLVSSFKLISSSRYIILARQNPKEELGGYAIQVRLLEGDQLVATYNLPSFSSKWTIGLAICRSEITSKLTSNVTLPFQSPFISPPHPKILLFDLMPVGGPSLDATHIHMVALSSCFFPTPDQLKPWPNNIIPWSAWGEHNTRFFLNSGFSPSVHMHRVCTPDSVMDFNPIDIDRDICLGNDEDIQIQATVIPKSRGLFKEDLITRLPYRIVGHRISANEFSYPTFWMDDCIFVSEGGKRVHSFL